MTTSTPQTTPVVYADVETTGLHRGRRIWEVALIRRDDPASAAGEEVTWLMIADVDLSHADSKALEIGGFYDRHPQYADTRPKPSGTRKPELVSERGAAKIVERATRGARLVGVNPTFDHTSLSRMLYAFGYHPAWDYWPLDLKSLAIGRLGLTGNEVIRSDDLAERCGVQPVTTDRHTALGDARWAQRWHEATLHPVARLARGGLVGGPRIEQVTSGPRPMTPALLADLNARQRQR